MRPEHSTLRVGLMGVGLAAYWEQFEGLRERLTGYLSTAESKIEAAERQIVNFGLVDTPEKAMAIGHACRTEDIDILLIYVTTYALSSTVLPVIQRAKVPVILLNLQPAGAIDYASVNRMPSKRAMTGEWLAFCSACTVPEIANVLRRLDIPFFQVTGMLEDDPACWSDLEEWLGAAAVVKSLAGSRLGLMGHYYSGMLDIATDLVQVSGRFGVHVEIIEPDELPALRPSAEDETTLQKLSEFHDFFEIAPTCSSHELLRAARTAVALDRLVRQKELDLLAYYYKGTGIPPNEDTASSVILGMSMLTARHIPVAGEYEIKNVLAMKIMDLFGAGGSFTEFYGIDFLADLLLLGHDGPGHAGIAQSRIKVKPLEVYHGKVGSGLSVEMSVKHGSITMLSVVEDRSAGFKLLFAEGESVPGEILEIGNTNSRYRFPPGARSFVQQWNSHGPAHHAAIGVGHVASRLHKLAALLRMPAFQIC